MATNRNIKEQIAKLEQQVAELRKKEGLSVIRDWSQPRNTDLPHLKATRNLRP